MILLLFNAGPLDITFAVQSPGVQVIMECFFPAQATGDALYQVFTNTNGGNPAGRLPATWPASLKQVGKNYCLNFEERKTPFPRSTTDPNPTEYYKILHAPEKALIYRAR